VKEVDVAGEGGDERPIGNREEEAQEPETLLLRQRAGVPPGQGERRIVRPPLREIVELIDQRRDEIERQLQAGMRHRQRRHVVIVLERMEPDPRERCGRADRVHIERLVEVPEDGDAESG